MDQDIFGDLRDWGRVMEQLVDMKSSGKLNEVQPGLARILRYRDNWKLRESALEAAKSLMQPSDEVIAEALGILTDDAVYIEARALAADAVGHMMTRRKSGQRVDPRCSRDNVAQTLRGLLESPQAPLLHEVVRRSLTVLEKA